MLVLPSPHLWWSTFSHCAELPSCYKWCDYPVFSCWWWEISDALSRRESWRLLSQLAVIVPGWSWGFSYFQFPFRIPTPFSMLHSLGCCCVMQTLCLGVLGSFWKSDGHTGVPIWIQSLSIHSPHYKHPSHPGVASHHSKQSSAPQHLLNLLQIFSVTRVLGDLNLSNAPGDSVSRGCTIHDIQDVTDVKLTTR